MMPARTGPAAGRHHSHAVPGHATGGLPKAMPGIVEGAAAACGAVTRTAFEVAPATLRNPAGPWPHLARANPPRIVRGTDTEPVRKTVSQS